MGPDCSIAKSPVHATAQLLEPINLLLHQIHSNIGGIINNGMMHIPGNIESILFHTSNYL